MNTLAPTFDSPIENVNALHHTDARISFYLQYHLKKSALHEMVRNWFSQNPSYKSEYMDDDTFLLIMEMDMRSYIDRVGTYVNSEEVTMLLPSTQDLAFFYKIERSYPGFIPWLEIEARGSASIVQSMKNWFNKFQSKL